MKKKLSVLLMAILIFIPTTINLEAKNNENEVANLTDVTTITRNSSSSETIKVTSYVKTINDAKLMASTVMGNPLEPGVEYIIETYKDGSTLSVTAIESKSDKMTGDSSIALTPGTYNMNTTYLYQYTNIFGQKKTAYTTYLNLKYYSNGDAGYVIQLTGTYTVYKSTYYLSWDSSYNQSNPYWHQLGLAVSGAGNCIHVYTGWYNPFDGNGSFSTTDL